MENLELPLELIESYFKDLNNVDFLELRKINKMYRNVVDNYIKQKYIIKYGNFEPLPPFIEQLYSVRDDIFLNKVKFIIIFNINAKDRYFYTLDNYIFIPDRNRKVYLNKLNDNVIMTINALSELCPNHKFEIIINAINVLTGAMEFKISEVDIFVSEHGITNTDISDDGIILRLRVAVEGIEGERMISIFKELKMVISKLQSIISNLHELIN